MNKQDIYNNLATLQRLSMNLEAAYTESEGEITEETVQMEEQVAAIRQMLLGDGIDELGRWLRSKEDQKAALKAEKNYIGHRIDSVDGTIDYIKGLIAQVMKEAGYDKLKGENGYSFTQYHSTKVSADKDALNERWLGIVEDAARAAGVPAYVTISLGASSKAVAEGDELPDVFKVEEADTVKFLKPRGGKE